MTKAKRGRPKGSGNDDRAKLLFMADLIAWEGIGIEEAAREVYVDEIRDAMTAKQLDHAHNKATGLAAKYRDRRDRLDTIGTRRMKLRKARAVSGISGFDIKRRAQAVAGASPRGTLADPPLPRYAKKIAADDAARTAEVIATLSRFAEWVQTGATPEIVPSRELRFAEQLELAAEYLRKEKRKPGEFKFLSNQ